MLGVLLFDDADATHKRRKAVRACKRCKSLKKRCAFTASSRRCHRCSQDNRACSFETEQTEQTGQTQHQHQQSERGGPWSESPSADLAETPETLSSHASLHSLHSLSSLPSLPAPERISRLRGTVSAATEPTPMAMTIPGIPGPSPPEDEPSGSALADQAPLTMDSHTGASPGPEPAGEANQEDMRFVTMLYLLDSSKNSTSTSTRPRDPRYATSKLISGTNPLSALLQRDLKEKIVNNSCSFRTPDPAPGSHNSSFRGRVQRRGIGVHSCDWEAYYRGLGASEARMQYLLALGCFDLPPTDRCARLLETYFAHVHPVLPVVDQKDFLSRYYGQGEPPPLVLLHAVFLAASRYEGGGVRGERTGRGEREKVEGTSSSTSEIRSHCDQLYSKLRALFETDVCAERVAVIQATLLASLHWEGREGLNSSIDCLSLAVRACQEMGLHRSAPASKTNRKGDIDRGNRGGGGQVPGPGPGPDPKLLRRLWWLTFACDRLTAAQEGTSFLINELDCDVEPLSADDFSGEDQLTCHVTLLNLALARLIEDVVRSLYAIGETERTLFSTRGVLMRQRLGQQLEQLADRITTTLLPEAEGFPHADIPDIRHLWRDILLTHVDAVRILMHRSFITYAEPSPSGLGVRCYASRDACRVHALAIVERLQALEPDSNRLRFCWPFTVYAVVNCLLVFWYDLSSPATSDPAELAQSRQRYAAVVQLLRAMGDTWWAAAAKHKLAEALAKAADKLWARQGVVVRTEGGGVRDGVRDDVRGGAHIEEDQSRSGLTFLAAAPNTSAMSDHPFLVQGSTATDTGHGFVDASGYQHPPTPHSGSTLNGLGLDPWSNDVLFSGAEDYWASLGLDFDMDVAENLFSILPTQGNF